MSFAPFNTFPMPPCTPVTHPSSGLGKDTQPLHRIALVRKRQRVSIRTVARNWDIDVTQVREQLDENRDLSLTELYRWQSLLKVPVAELLVDNDDALSAPVMIRAQLVKLMKTAVTIRENTRERSTQRLVHALIEQFVELMPELAEVGPWHGNGSRRSTSEIGQSACRQISDDIFPSGFK